jgi:hypothetical protein
MSKITDIVVLNTVSAGGTEFTVNNNGLVNVLGADSFKAERITNMQIQPYVAEALQAQVITPTAANNTTYRFSVSGVDITNGLPYYSTFTHLSSAAATRLEIVSAFVALVNADTKLNAIASVSGSNPNETLTLTAKTGYPIFTIIESDANLSVAAPSTAGVIGVGLGSSITAKYPSSSFPAISTIVAAGQYTTVNIEYEDIVAYGEGSALGNQYKVLTMFVREGVTNVQDLIGSYGTITGLKAGYSVSFAAITGTAGSNTTNVQTMTSGVLGTEDVVAGDFVVGDTGSAANTVRKVISTLTQTTFLTTTATAITGSAFRVAKWRAFAR